VAAVQSYVNLILTGYISTGELNPTLTRVKERLQEMLDLIRDLLELAQLKQAKDRVTADASPQPLAEILTEVYELFQEQAHQKRQIFQIEILDHPIIIADRAHLKQIWTNLISNAIKYTPEGGQITISLETDDQQVIGSVADSGIGISEEDLPHLFQDFFRSEQAKASGEIGTGLGLSIVKQIVDYYGGEIKATSRLGHGSRFTFTLPLEPAVAGQKQELPAVRSEPDRPLAYPGSHSRSSTFSDH
jgi:signal transduction histidine kinase